MQGRKIAHASNFQFLGLRIGINYSFSIYEFHIEFANDFNHYPKL